MARDLKRINAYPEFRTAAGIDGVRAAVVAGNPPPGTPNQQARFAAKYLNGSWVVTNTALPVPGHSKIMALAAYATAPLRRLIY